MTAEIDDVLWKINTDVKTVLRKERISITRQNTKKKANERQQNTTKNQ